MSNFDQPLAIIAELTDVQRLQTIVENGSRHYGCDHVVPLAAQARLAALATKESRLTAHSWLDPKRIQKFRAFYAMILECYAKGIKLTFAEVSMWLNAQGFLTSAGTPYVIGGMGTARFVSAAYYYVQDELGENPDPVALTVTNQNGNYAYED